MLTLTLQGRQTQQAGPHLQLALLGGLALTAVRSLAQVHSLDLKTPDALAEILTENYVRHSFTAMPHL